MIEIIYFMDPMFYYCCPGNFVFLPFFFVPPPQPTPVEEPSETLSVDNLDSQVKSATIEEYSDQMIRLSATDLEVAGYNSRKKPWTEEEDQKLMQLVASGLKWNAISKQMTGRNTKMCYARHKRLLAKRDSPLRVRYWTNAEDKLLMRLVETEGTNWKYLSTFFNDRNSKQIRERYINALKPNISSEPWTEAEELHMIELVNQHGKKWNLISKELKIRSENQVKNRFYGRILTLNKRKIEHEARTT